MLHFANSLSADSLSHIVCLLISLLQPARILFDKMGTEDLMAVISDVALPALKSLHGAADDLPKKGLCWIIIFQLLHAMFCIVDSATNAWEFIHFETVTYFNATEKETIHHLVGQWGGYVLCFSIVPGISRFAMTCVMIHTLLKRYKTVLPSEKNNNSFVTEFQTLLYWMLFNMIMEFLFEILGINVTKLFIAFKSELALLALQTTASKVSGGITLALASFDYILLWRRTYIAYNKGTGCCTCCTLGLEYKIGIVGLIFFQSTGLGTAIYSFLISIGVVNVYPYESKDFYINIINVLGLSSAVAVAAIFIMLIIRCIRRLCNGPRNNTDRVISVAADPV